MDVKVSITPEAIILINRMMDGTYIETIKQKVINRKMREYLAELRTPPIRTLAVSELVKRNIDEWINYCLYISKKN